MENKRYGIDISRSGKKEIYATFATVLDLESWFSNRHCAETNTIAFIAENGDYIFSDLNNCCFMIREIK